MTLASRLGAMVRAARRERGWTLPQAATEIGYRNIDKGARRLAELEQRGSAKLPADRFEALVAALGLEPDQVSEARRLDERDRLLAWHRWARQPVEPELVLRVLPAVYLRLPLPAHLRTQAKREAYASKVAAERAMAACLVLNRRLRIWFDAEGTLTHRTEATPDHDGAPLSSLS